MEFIQRVYIIICLLPVLLVVAGIRVNLIVFRFFWILSIFAFDVCFVYSVPCSVVEFRMRHARRLQKDGKHNKHNTIETSTQQ